MKQGANKDDRREQRIILQSIYADYNPIRHDLYVERYNNEIENNALREYMTNRGIISTNDERN